jgi:polar amino acid transport system substrate-binding protein
VLLDLRVLLPFLRGPLLLGALALGPLAQASPLCPERPIRYAHYEFGLLYAPEQGGIDEDIRQELEKRSGCAFEVSLQPRARTWLEIERGRVDMAGSGIQTPARDRFAWFAHYVVEDNHVVLTERVPEAVRSMDEFLADPKLRMGGVRSFSFSPYYDDKMAGLQRLGRVVTVTDTRSLFRQLAMENYEAVIASPFLTRYYIQKLGLKPARMVDWDPGPATPSGLVMSKKSFTPAQAARWKALVQEMLNDGTVQRIVAQRVGDSKAAAQMVYRGR